MTPTPSRTSFLLAALLVVAAGSGLALRSGPSPSYDLPDDLGIVAAVSALAAHHDHGWTDQLPASELDAVAAERRIVATCGYVSAWAVRVLTREGFEARLVHTLTLDEWDDRNNGHTLIEAKFDGRWVVFDIDRDVWPWRDGAPLSLAGYADAVADGDYELRELSPDRTTLLTTLMEQDERLIQVPLIGEGDRWFYSDDPARVLSYSPSYKELTEGAWLERFYPGEATG